MSKLRKAYGFVDKGKIKPKNSSMFEEGEVVAIVPIEEWLKYLDNLDSKYNNLEKLLKIN